MKSKSGYQVWVVAFGMLLICEVIAPNWGGINQESRVYAQSLNLNGIYSGTVTNKPLSCSSSYTGPAIFDVSVPPNSFAAILCQGSSCASDPAELVFASTTIQGGTVQGAFGRLSNSIAPTYPLIAAFFQAQFQQNSNGTTTVNLTTSLGILEQSANPNDECEFAMSYVGTSVVISAPADMSITKTASANPVSSGGSLTYTLTVTNNGPNTAQFVNIGDSLPQGVSLVSHNDGIFQCSASAGIFNCGTSSMNPGQSSTVTIVVNVVAPAGTILSNTATVSSGNPDPNPNNNSATVTTTVGAGDNPQIQMNVPANGAASASTSGGGGSVQAGDAVGNETANKNANSAAVSGGLPYGTAVFSVTQDGNVVSEAGVPASPPTTHGRIFIDFRTGVAAKARGEDVSGNNIDTGFAVVNRGTAVANITYTLGDANGVILTPQGHGPLAQGDHLALFIDQLSTVAPDFVLPSGFAATTRFATLDISSDQPLSILALRLTTNQRGETLITTTPVADLTQSLSSVQLYFPQLVDGGGYKTTFVLLNTSLFTETGRLLLFKDDGSPLTATNNVTSASGSSFSYSIPAGGFYLFQSDGSPSAVNAGSAQVMPDPGTSAPVGAGIFSYEQGGISITESGIPSAVPTTHAHIYIDKSGGHDTGLAIANPTGGTPLNVTLNAFQTDGATPIGFSTGPVILQGNGHTAAFVGQSITGLPPGFAGVLDISSAQPFVALTLRSLTNARGDFLLTTFPIADFNQSPVTPLVFPQIADGGGYRTQFILLSDGGAAIAIVSFFNDSGSPLPVGKSAR